MMTTHSSLRSLAALTLALALPLAACGGGDSTADASEGDIDAGEDPVIDAAPDVDATPPCTALTWGELAVLNDNSTTTSFGAVTTPDLGTAQADRLEFQFYPQGEPAIDLIGMHDLASGAFANYSTCAACLLVAVDVTESGTAAKYFFQQSGTLTLDADPFGRVLMGSMTAIRLVEVTIDPKTFASTPVAGGECVELMAQTFNFSDAALQ